MSSTRLSLIIPVYNVAPLLTATLDAVAAQDMDGFEAILVDDGSTDGSGALCDSRAEADARFRVVHTHNGGPSAARNAGLDAARGRYIVFMDSDDIVDPRYLRLLHEAVAEEDADVATCRFSRRPGRMRLSPRRRCVDGRRLLEMMLYQRGADSSPCCKIFRRSLFDGLRFREGTIFEDLDLLSRLYLRVGRAVLTGHCLYYYRPVATSLLSAFSPRRFDALEVTADIQRRLSPLSPRLAAAAADRRLSAAFNAFLLAARHGCGDVADRAWSVIRSLRRRSLLDPRVRLKNKAGIIISYMGRRALSLVGA